MRLMYLKNVIESDFFLTISALVFFKQAKKIQEEATSSNYIKVGISRSILDRNYDYYLRWGLRMSRKQNSFVSLAWVIFFFELVVCNQMLCWYQSRAEGLIMYGSYIPNPCIIKHLAKLFFLKKTENIKGLLSVLQ